MTDIKLAKYSDVEGKVDKDGEKVLSDNNYTTKEKSKLEGIEERANRYMHPAVHTADMIVGLHPVAKTGKTTQLDNDAGFITGAYDNTNSMLTATNINDAIDELKILIDNLSSKE